MPRGRPQIYDWDKLLDGNEHALVKGRDFQIDARALQRMIMTNARKREVEGIRTQSDDGGRVVRILKKTRRSRRANYPWDVWLDGAVHVLVRGEHFTVDVEIMRAGARRAAKERGLKLRSKTRRIEGRTCLGIQALR